MEAERWETKDAIADAWSRFAAAIPGYQPPDAYAVGTSVGGRFEFARVNEREHALPAVVLATVLGGMARSCVATIGRDTLADAVALLAPAEACPDYDHPNLAAWRALLAGPSHQFVVVLVSSLGEPALHPADRALRRVLRERRPIPPGWQGLPVDQLRRIAAELEHAIGGAPPDVMLARAARHANPVGWLAWHLTRSHDRNLSEIAGEPQQWTSRGWAARFGLPPDPADTGYGHSPGQVDAFPAVPGDLILAYHDAVLDTAERWLRTAPDTDLERIAPSPTLGTNATVQERLVGVLNEGFQHVGQIHLTLGSTYAPHEAR